jgi:hypothetical protein
MKAKEKQIEANAVVKETANATPQIFKIVYNILLFRLKYKINIIWILTQITFFI